MRRARLLAVLVGLAVLMLAPVPQAHARPFTFLSQSTDQLAVPGAAGGTEITPEGSLHTGYAELFFRAGPRLDSYDGSLRSVADPRVPEFRSHSDLAGVRYSLTTFAAPFGSQAANVVRVTLRNLRRRPVLARWATAVRHTGGGPGRYSWTLRFPSPAKPARPGLYFQPGALFDPSARYRFAHGAVLRNGRVLYVGSKLPRGARIRHTLRLGPEPQSENRGFGEMRYSVRLPPAGSTQLDFAMPAVPAAPAALPRLHRLLEPAVERRLVRTWHSRLSPAMKLRLPEPAVEAAFYASLVNLLAPRYRSGRYWVQPVNKLQYHAFWLRDAAVITNALDLAGLHTPARENLRFFGTWQLPSGLFISRAGQLDGVGQALWAIGQHARRTRDRRFAARMLPRITRAVDWIRRARQEDDQGLLPSATPGDNEGGGGHVVGDDFWAAAGLREAVALARLARQRPLAAQFDAERADLDRAIRAAVAAATARTGGPIPPILEGGGQDWGNLWASYPAPVLPADGRAVTATLRAVRSRFNEGLATYANGGVTHGYLGFRVFETELLRGEQGRAIRGLYDSLAHMTPTWGGFEFALGRALTWEFDNLTPHGWFAAEYVALLRNMLVREDGGEIVLASAVPPSWLRPGRTVSVQNAHTMSGPVSWKLSSHRGGATLSWRAAVPRATPLLFTLPSFERGGGRRLALRSRSGRLRLHWRLPRKLPSYAGALSRLRRLYKPTSGYAR